MTLLVLEEMHNKWPYYPKLPHLIPPSPLTSTWPFPCINSTSLFLTGQSPFDHLRCNSAFVGKESIIMWYYLKVEIMLKVWDYS